MRLVIVGFGIVGHNLHELFPDAEVHDPYQGGGFFAPPGATTSLSCACQRRWSTAGYRSRPCATR